MAPRARVVSVVADEPATLLILAGGRSRRMGRPKPSLPVRGTTLLAWMVERLGPAFSETIVCGLDAALVLPALAVRAIPDRRPGAGPLAGIEAGLGAMRSDVAFVIACDMPRVPPSLARALVALSRDHDAATPRVAGRPQPTCAAYRRSALSVVTHALDAGELRATDALSKLRVRYVDEDEQRMHGAAPKDLTSVNTPAEYEAFLRSL